MTIWPVESLASLLIEAPRNGVSPSTGGSVRDSVLTLSAITRASFDESAMKDADFKDTPPSSKRVDHRDFLVCRGNGNPHLVGKGFFPVRDLPGVVFPDTMIALRIDSSRIDRKYFEFAWQSKGVRGQIEAGARTTNGTFKINQGVVEGIQIPVPPIENQRRIAMMLGQADELRVKRSRAISLLDDLAQSIFLDMFGVSFESMRRQWPMHTLGSLSTVFSDGPFGSNLKSSHYRDSGIRVIRLQNIGVGRFIDNNAAFISEEHFARLGKHMCLPGDVIIGTLGDPNLRAFVQPPEVAVALNKADCVQMRVDSAKVIAAYVSALLNQPIIEHMAKSLMHGQTRTRISMSQLREMEVPVPPLQLQHEFEIRSELLANQRSRQNDSLAELDALFSSLQAKAFRGEL
jgi:type I restriction enzyme, S subunit